MGWLGVAQYAHAHAREGERFSLFYGLKKFMAEFDLVALHSAENGHSLKNNQNCVRSEQRG
jgi:hypothetical protein